MSTILAGGSIIDAAQYLEDPDVAQEALENARRNFGHALCRCTSPARQLVIREVNKTLYLAVWPNDGPFHHPSCEFHREPHATSLSESGPEGASQMARAVQLDSQGNWDVRLDLPRQSPPAPVKAVQSAAEAAKVADPTPTHPQRNKLPLGAFLTWLWDTTPMCRWVHGWTRDWWRVMRAIRSESGAIMVDGFTFNDLLYIPPPFQKAREKEIHSEWESFTAPLLATANDAVVRRGFVLCELKAIDKTEFGYRLLAKNLAKPIFMSADVHHQLRKSSPLALALCPDQKAQECSIVALLLVEGTGKGNVRVVDAALMLTNKAYMPVSTRHELELANHLIDAGRTFTRGAGKHVAADFVLRDTTPSTACVIYSLDHMAYRKKRDAVVAECKAAGANVWIWHTHTTERPPLPLPDTSETPPAQ